MLQPTPGNEDSSLREALSLGEMRVLGFVRPMASAERRDRKQTAVSELNKKEVMRNFANFFNVSFQQKIFIHSGSEIGNKTKTCPQEFTSPVEGGDR